MKIECVYSRVCQMWINNILANSGHYTVRCKGCGYYLSRKDVTQSLTEYTPSVKRFLTGEDKA